MVRKRRNQKQQVLAPHRDEFPVRKGPVEPTGHGPVEPVAKTKEQHLLELEHRYHSVAAWKARHPRPYRYGY